MIQPKLGQMIIDDKGINRVIQLDDWGGYTLELIIPKETFIEAYEKWVAKESNTISLEEYNEVLDKIKAEIYAKSEVRYIPTDYDIFPQKIKRIIHLDDAYKIVDNYRRKIE